MKRNGSVPFALLATLALAWSLPAFAYGDCANGKMLYNKTNSLVPTACSNSSCHKSTVDANNIQDASANPGLIDQALDGPPGDPTMTVLDLRDNLPLSPSDIDDLATWIFYAPSCPSSGAPNLQAAPAPVSFAATNVGSTSATTTVTITNAGTAAAMSVTASSGDATHFPLTANSCNGVTVNAGASCSFKVAFHPTAAGLVSANVTVNRTGGTLTVGVSGSGTTTAGPGQLSMTSSINFGSLTVGTTSAPTSVTISNTGGTAVAVSSVASNNPSEFAIASNTCSSVNPGGSCSVGVTFRPSVSGARSATITVTSNGVGSPQTLSASGTGTTTATPGQLSMSSSIDFGNVTVGMTSSLQTVTVTNSSGASVLVTSVASNDANEFTIVSNSCTSVGAGASCSIGITFKPSAAGARAAAITIASNGTGSPQAINTSGTGMPTGTGAAANYQGLFYNAPAESEAGWGINFAHQGDIIFATWFTYDATGKALWLSMTAAKTAPGVYSGTLQQTHGPAFSAVPFNPNAVTAADVGNATLSFSDVNGGTFDYTLNGIHQTKTITRQVFSTVPTCSFGTLADLTLATNYQDLWYAAPAESEAGWGVNFTHQGDIIFATWFTYDTDGTPLWLSATAGRTSPGVYTGG